jgi:cytochrome c oxidase subunit 3
MSTVIRHFYHLVDDSPWPIFIAGGGVILTSRILNWFYFKDLDMLFMRAVLILLIRFQWWRDVSREGAYLGLHSLGVELGLRRGIVLFIVSEVFFFLSFFWAFFHRRLSADPALGGVWPPVGVKTFDAFGIPLLNTLVLISSGVRVTWAHHALIRGEHDTRIKSLLITVGLGLYFTGLQAIEYLEASFSFSDGRYGSTFFLATGFHGFHVVVGTLFLVVCLSRLILNIFSHKHHLGFEIAAWYWHFVDVVWLFLYVFIYWWRGM